MAKLAYRLFWKNNASATLTTQLESGVTSVIVDDGSVFGNPSATYCTYLTFDDGANVEIMRATGRSGNTLTVVRGQEGTSGTQVWPVDEVLENRLTTEQLNDLQPGEGYVGTIAIGLSADTDSVDAIAIGNAAYAAEGMAGSGSHIGQVAIGASAKAKYNGCIAIGWQALAEGSTSSIAIGEDAVASGNSAIHIGEGNGTTSGETTGDYGTTIGQFSNNFGTNSIVIGYSSETDANSDYAIAIGNNASITSGDESICIGRDTTVGGALYGIVVGSNSSAIDGRATVVGPYALAGGYKSITLGDSETNWHTGSGKMSPAVCPRETDNWSLAGSGAVNHLMSAPVTVTFPPMDLGAPQTWTTAIAYNDQEVVVDPTPVGTEQHYLVIGASATVIDTDTFYDGGPFNNNASTESGEPTWATVQGSSANATKANAKWVMIDPKSGVELNVFGLANSTAKYKFVPTKISFYCFEITGTHTTKPTFDFGNEISDTAYKSAEAIDLITADDQMQSWDINGDDAMVPGAENLKITLGTAGDGTLFMGKFIVEGIIMALRG